MPGMISGLLSGSKQSPLTPDAIGRMQRLRQMKAAVPGGQVPMDMNRLARPGMPPPTGAAQVAPPMSGRPLQTGAPGQPYFGGGARPWNLPGVSLNYTPTQQQIGAPGNMEAVLKNMLPNSAFLPKPEETSTKKSGKSNKNKNNKRVYRDRSDRGGYTTSGSYGSPGSVSGSSASRGGLY